MLQIPLRSSNGKQPLHMCCKQLAKVFGIARKHTPLVPYNGQRIPNWLPPVAHTNHTQGVTIDSYGRWNDRDSEPCLGKRQQRMWGTTLDQNIRLKLGETADRIERLASHKAGVLE